MQVSHVLYKVNNLKKGFDYFKNKGFHIEYGSKYNPSTSSGTPHNALIYFSKGPYIEVLEKAPLPFYAKLFLKIIGKGKVVKRLEQWGKQPEGFFEICLENYNDNFSKEETILKKYKQDYFITKSKRLDPSNRLLKWKLLFPLELKLPFLMTNFNIDPKPKSFVHPNGVKGIKRIAYGTSPELISLVRELCDDERLDLLAGDGAVEVEYEREIKINLSPHLP